MRFLKKFITPTSFLFYYILKIYHSSRIKIFCLGVIQISYNLALILLVTSVKCVLNIIWLKAEVVFPCQERSALLRPLGDKGKELRMSSAIPQACLSPWPSSP